MDKFLERDNLPRLNQEEIENMNRPITGTEIETVMKTSNRQKSGTIWFIGKFYQTFREVLTPILQKIFPKIAEEGTLPSSQFSAPIQNSFRTKNSVTQ